MTRYILLIAMTAMGFLNCPAQASFQEALAKTFIAFDTTQDYQKKVDASNKIGLIAKK